MERNEQTDNTAQEQKITEKIREKRRKYYEDNKYRLCNYTLNCYCIRAIEQIRDSYRDAVDEHITRYPFEIYAEPYIRKELSNRKIYPSQARYADCYDAGMFAYLYSIHRCAAMKYNHSEYYIKKMIRIYVICAIVVYEETKNLCRINGFSEIRLNADTSVNRY